MAVLTVQEITAAGLVPSYVAADVAGDTFVAQRGYSYVLHVKNGGGGSVTVGVADFANATGPVGAAAYDPDLSQSVGAGAERMINLDANRFADPADDGVDITYSGVTSVTVAVFLVRR